MRRVPNAPFAAKALLVASFLPSTLAAGHLEDSIFHDGFEAGSECAWTLDLVYVDLDNDDYGDENDEGQAPLCPSPDALVANNLDCDDLDPNVNPGVVEQCNLIDDDCDTAVDGSDSDLPLPPCELQNGVCEGSSKGGHLCPSGFWEACTSSEYGSWSASYEVVETTCDELDNDCDGEVDEQGCT